MEGKGRENYGIFPSENCQLKSLGTVTRFFGITLGFGKFIIGMWGSGNGIGNKEMGLM